VTRFEVLVFLVVLAGQAPRGMVTLRVRSAFGARFNDGFIRTLQGARFFEAPMPSLFHVALPVFETCVTNAVYRPSPAS
jgi:hypothetical protein